MTHPKVALAGRLTGNFHVRRYTTSIKDVRCLWPKARDWSEIRRHALKLRFWPERFPEGDNGELLDLDWSWIQALKGKNVGELRINDRIGGHENIRLIFFVGGASDGVPMPTIWILAALAKKRDSFTRNEIDVFDARRSLVVARHYDADQF